MQSCISLTQNLFMTAKMTLRSSDMYCILSNFLTNELDCTSSTITQKIRAFKHQHHCCSAADSIFIHFRHCSTDGNFYMNKEIQQSAPSRQAKLTLDANWHWIRHTERSKNCYTGNQWNQQYCSDPVESVQS